MTRYLDVQSIRRLIGSVGLETFTIRLAEFIRSDYLRWAEFSKSPRFGIYSHSGVIELMPIADKSLYNFKYVNGHPGNTLKNLPTVMAFNVLADVDTGLPLLLAEATVCTAIRTAAASALAASVLARSNSRTLALIGCGAQSEFQAIAFKGLLGVHEIRVFDLDPAAMAKFARNMEQVGGVSVVQAKSVEDAADGADIITLATASKHHAAVLTAEMVKPGVHINAIGGDCPGKTELHPEVLEGAKVFVQFEPQSRHEGDVQQMTPDFEVTELSSVLSGKSRGREFDHEVTIFDSVGFAIEDFSTMRLLWSYSEDQDLGTRLDLIASPSDPKDLFGFLTHP